MVATNEFEHAWMDEGFNTYATARVMAEAMNPNRVESRYFGGFIPWSFRDIPVTRIDNDRLAAFRFNAEADAQWTPTFQYWPATAGIISYNKTALWMHTLEQRVGWPVMQRIMSTYFERWKFKHPRPSDFFDIVREVTGQGTTGSSTRCIAAPTRSTTAYRSFAANVSTRRPSARRWSFGATAKRRSLWTW